MRQQNLTHSQTDLFGGTSFYPNSQNVSAHTVDVNALKDAIPNQAVPNKKILEMIKQFDLNHDLTPHFPEIKLLLGEHRSDLFNQIEQERSAQGKFKL